ncbi:hypothetical protein [Mesorhizobium sp. B2-4-17]|uniref:hypothetical protein n=1 Tax=Mesorhizobium sp. B2-4-17 TaxID=2589932 RepID=UPI0015E3110D|nr:hypothetical protein [Mesorhizobium sp. B2-4-17]
MRIDLAVDGVVQAGAIGRCVGHGIGLGLGDLAVQPAGRDLGVEGLLLRLAPFIVLGNSLPIAVERRRRPARRRSVGIRRRIACIAPALANGERNDVYHWRCLPKLVLKKGRAAPAIAARPDRAHADAAFLGVVGLRILERAAKCVPG